MVLAQVPIVLDVLVVVTAKGMQPFTLSRLNDAIGAAVTQMVLVITSFPHGLPAVSVTVYVPGCVYVWQGENNVEVLFVPLAGSPKSQL